MTDGEREFLLRQVKVALKWIGPREILGLVMSEVVERRDMACNREAKARLRIVGQKIEAALNWMDGRDPKGK